MKVYKVYTGREDQGTFFRTQGEAAKYARFLAWDYKQKVDVTECTLALSGKDAIVAALNNVGIFSEQTVVYTAAVRRPPNQRTKEEAKHA